MMVHSKALYRDLVRRDKKVDIPEEAVWSVSEAKNPWKSGKPYSESEVADYLRQGAAGHRLRDFDPVHFSKDLVPASGLQRSETSGDWTSVTGRNIQTFYTWINSTSASIELKITGGLITHYRNRGNVKIDLWRILEKQGAEQNDVRASHGESAPDGVERLITLQAQQTGLHKITVSDGGDMTKVAWKPGTSMTTISSLDDPGNFSGSWSLCFYVPKGTRTLGLYSEGSGTLLDGAGNVAFTFGGKRGGFCGVEVPEGQDGAVWRFHRSTGVKRLVTVPACLAANAGELLLPREVVEADFHQPR
jgi:hypothetical protein